MFAFEFEGGQSKKKESGGGEGINPTKTNCKENLKNLRLSYSGQL